jgi:hypothetical protein
VWQQVEIWSGDQGLKQNQHTSRIKDWWTHLNTAQGHTTAAAQKRAQIIVYKAWDLWKERRRRVFDNETADVQHLLASIQDDIQSLHMARDEPEYVFVSLLLI